MRSNLLQRLGAAFALTCALAAAALLATDLDAHQYGGPMYVSPSKPLFPTSRAECSALEAAWQRIRSDIGRQHQACLDRAAGSRCPVDSASGCTCVECAPYHDASSLGKDDVNACYAEVDVYLEAERKRKAEEDRKQQEQERADRERAERAKREERDNAQNRFSRESAREREARIERDRRDAEERALDRAREASKRALEAFRLRTETRDREREQLEAREAEARQSYDRDRKQLLGRTNSMADQIRDLLGVAPATAAGPTTTLNGGDFDLSSLASPSTMVDRVLDLGELALPAFAALPFGFLRNTLNSTLQAADELGAILSNIDAATPSDVNAIFDRYQQRVYSPKALGGAIFDHIVGGLTDEYVTPHVKEAIFSKFSEQIRIRTDSFLETGKTNRLTRRWELAEDQPRSHAQMWITPGGPTGPKRSSVVRDDAGIPLLQDRNGNLYGFDRTRDRVLYQRREVQMLIEEKNLSVVRAEFIPWKAQHVYFAPIRAEDAEDFLDLADSAAAGWVAAALVNPIADAVKDGRPIPESQLERLGRLLEK